MDQIKIGAFLKELRKKTGLTQEQLAEKLSVSSRTVSRWETGSNMPDIGMLVEIADLYGVSIPEIIAGERKSEIMNQETRDTAMAMAEYGRNEIRAGKLKTVGALTAVFGVFIIISALAVFPSESSWGSIYAILGSVLLLIGAYLSVLNVLRKRSLRALAVLGLAILLFGAFAVSDYITVAQFHRVPRFRYMSIYDSRYPDQIVHKTLFFTAVQKNPGAGNEEVYIAKEDN